MRTLILVGSSLLLFGIFVFTRGSGWSFGYMIPGGIVGFAGVLVLALAAAAATAPSARRIKAVRPRRRVITPRPGRMRRVPVSA